MIGINPRDYVFWHIKEGVIWNIKQKFFKTTVNVKLSLEVQDKYSLIITRVNDIFFHLENSSESIRCSINALFASRKIMKNNHFEIGYTWV